MKTTQDLAIFLRKFSEERGKQTAVMIHADKSFVLYEEDGGAMMVPIYSSTEIADGLDINDLPYEDATYFSAHIEELASVKQVLEEAAILQNKDKFADL